MTRRVWAAIAAVVLILAVIAGVVAWKMQTAEPDFVGDPEVDTVDPIRDDPENAAVSLVSAVNTWRPAEQESPVAAAVAVEDRLVGKYAQLAASDPSDYPLPPEWEEWARWGDVHKTIATVAPGSAPVEETATKAVVTLDLQKMVAHADGEVTRLGRAVVDAEMVKEADVWKLADIRYRAVPGL